MFQLIMCTNHTDVFSTVLDQIYNLLLVKTPKSMQECHKGGCVDPFFPNDEVNGLGRLRMIISPAIN